MAAITAKSISGLTYNRLNPLMFKWAATASDPVQASFQRRWAVLHTDGRRRKSQITDTENWTVAEIYWTLVCFQPSV
jgi:hypothetical protein